MAQLTDPQRREFLCSVLATATLAAIALSVPGCMSSDRAIVPDLHIELRAAKGEGGGAM